MTTNGPLHKRAAASEDCSITGFQPSFADPIWAKNLIDREAIANPYIL